MWHLRDVPPGAYRIEARATVDQESASASLPITVRERPTARVALARLKAVPEGMEATFRADIALAAGASARSLLWQPEPGVVVGSDKPELSYVYRAGGRVPLAFTVDDEKGGSDTVSCALQIEDFDGLRKRLEYCGEECPPEEYESVFVCFGTCACQSMNLLDRRGVESFTYCDDAAMVTRFPAGCVAGAAGQCPAGKTAYRCPTGRAVPTSLREPHLTWSFEIIAQLAPGSDPDECEEGQYARVTRTRNGAPIPNHQAPSDPDDGTQTLPRADGSKLEFESVEDEAYPGRNDTDNRRPKFGADDYVEPSRAKRHDGRRISWFDAPGIGNAANAEVNGIPQPASTMDDEYISFVRGDDGTAADTCWCRFSIDNRYDPNPAGPAGDGLVLIDQNKCTRTGP